MKIKVAIVINKNIENVWEYWNSPESIRGWAFASNDWECLHAENDLRVGGRFLTRMSAKDKSVSFDFTGTYLEMEEYKYIKYICDGGDKRVVQITFEKISDTETKITEDFDPENENSAERQRDGWQAILNNFKKYVESN